MEANFSLENLKERADTARKQVKAYIEKLEEQYVTNTERRKRSGIPVVAFNGYGRAGKDTAAEYVGKLTRERVIYGGSSSWRGMPIMAAMVGIPAEELYKIRHLHRDFMIKAFHAIRGDDYSFLVRLALGAADIVVGVRGEMELDEIVRQKIVHLNVWVDNRRVEVDKTVEYSAEDCDVIIPNHGSKLDYYERVNRLAWAVYPGQMAKV